MATPCSAPFLGTAIGFALARGPVEIAAVFLALGIGMALPYLAVAAVPALAAHLPRPGKWMIWLKRVMGLALVLTAAWLVDILAAQIGTAMALAVGAVLALIALVLVGARLTARRQWSPRLALPSVAVLAALAFLLSTLAGDVGVSRTVTAGTDRAGVEWRSFDRDLIPQLVGAGRVVFVDVTADWCVTCQVNKKMVLNSQEVGDRLASPAVVAMRADWTRPDPAIAAYLASFDRYGIPFNAVYGPGAPQGLALSELLSRGQVLDALDQAGRGTVATRD
jgi:suppressor for copper-sensitivity B